MEVMLNSGINPILISQQTIFSTIIHHALESISTDNGLTQLVTSQYAWNSNEMQQVFRLLDWYKDNMAHTLIMSGLWSSSINFTSTNISFYESEEFAQLQIDLLSYLINTKGYDNIT